MQKCKYNGEAIYAFNVMGENQTINYNLEKEWKKAGEKGELVCDECEAPVIFRCGKIYKPHFAHKSELQGGNPCTYCNETEEHIEGKKLLLNYMKGLYPEIFAEMRYKLPKKRKADLYFKFEDGQELVIEFQRQRLSVTHWDEKREFYNSLGLNNAWFLSGKREELENVIREYELSFWNRMVLNDSNNIILFLDVDKEEVTTIKKVVITDNDTNGVIYDKLYHKTYRLRDIIILPDGSIKCDFDEECSREADTFVQAYFAEKQKEKEEKERFRKALQDLEEQKDKEREEREEREKKHREEKERLEQLVKQKNEIKVDNEKTDVFTEIGYTRKGSIQSTYKPYQKKGYNYYDRNESYYRDKVSKAICGYKYGKENLINLLSRGGYNDFNIVKNIFQEQIRAGNTKAKKVYDEVMKIIGIEEI